MSTQYLYTIFAQFTYSLQNTTSFYRLHKTNYRTHEKFPTRLND